MTQETTHIPKLRFPEFEGAWENLSYSAIAKIKSASRVHKDQWTTKGVRFFRSSDVVAKYKGRENQKAFISEELYESLSLKSGNAAKGDILVTGGGSIGIPYLISDDLPIYFKDADLLWFKFKSSICSLFIYTYFSTEVFRKYLRSITHIGTIAHYTIEQAKETPVHLPNTEEQQKIASFLTSVDGKVGQLQRKKAGLEDYKKGMMQQLFSQQTRFKDDQGDDFPDWEEKKLGEVLKVGSGKDYKHLANGNIPVYGSGGIMTTVSDFLYEGESVCIGRKGTIDQPQLLSGKFWTVDTLFYTHSFKHSLPKFIYAIFQQINWYKYNEASGVPSLSKSTIENIKISLPHPAEQQKIANYLTSLDQKIELTNKKLTQAQSFKKGLLQQMFV